MHHISGLYAFYLLLQLATSIQLLLPHKDHDFFTDPKDSEMATLRAQYGFNLAFDSLKSKYADDASELAVLSPVNSGCAWLKIEFIERAGLGHTFSCWAKYLLDAVRNKLTYHSSFYSTAHDNFFNLNASANYFGFHSVFFWSRFPGRNSSINIIDVGRDRRGCNSLSLTRAVEQYKARHGNFSCSRGDTVFMCHNELEDFQNRLLHSLINITYITRAVFESGRARYGVLYQRKEITSARELNNSLILVLHMRRGDVLQSRRVDPHRLVSFGVYINILKQILLERMSYNTDKTRVRSNSGNAYWESYRPISIFILCEGAQDDRQIIEYNENNPHRTYKRDAVMDLAKECSSFSKCTLEVLWNASYLEAFHSMCTSDILVTSTSGFSWVASALCNPPMTVGIKFSNDFEGIRNVVHVKSKNNLLHEFNTSITLLNLHSAWERLMETISPKMIL